MTEEKELISLIPSSRVKNYLSKEKLNKEFDEIIGKIKAATESFDLSTVLSEEMQKKVGAIIKQKEEKQEPVEINIIAVDLLSKQKFKFSHSSFKVLSVFLDIMIEDLTLNVMDEVIKNKKTIINTKYVYTAKTDSPLYAVYSKLNTFVSNTPVNENSTTEVVSEDQTEENVSTEEVVEENSTEEESSSESSINFEFYIRKICNKLKQTKEEYSKIKVSNNYQKFCSNLVLEFLDIVAPLTTILLEVMTTKTISQLVFETILKIQLYNNSSKDVIMEELHKRLSVEKK